MFLSKATKTVFGKSINIDTEKDLIVVCTNNGGGWVPRSVLLPHQLYEAKVHEWLREDERIIEVVAFPIDCTAYQTVWVK